MYHNIFFDGSVCVMGKKNSFDFTRKNKNNTSVVVCQHYLFLILFRDRFVGNNTRR